MAFLDDYVKVEYIGKHIYQVKCGTKCCGQYHNNHWNKIYTPPFCTSKLMSNVRFVELYPELVTALYEAIDNGSGRLFPCNGVIRKDHN